MITVVGEALVDLVAGPDGRTFTAHPGGSPANVAVGLARLGTSVTLATTLGDDMLGRLVTEHVQGSGVTLDPLPGQGRGTSVAFVALDADGAATYDFRIDWVVSRVPQPPDDCRCVHTGPWHSHCRPERR